MKTILFALLLAAGVHAHAWDRPPVESRARWACSAFIADRLSVPGSVEWTRRSQWPSMQNGPHWYVFASFTARNRANVKLRGDYECEMAYDAAGDAWRLVKMRKLS